jgi:hypothetical protein
MHPREKYICSITLILVSFLLQCACLRMDERNHSPNKVEMVSESRNLGEDEYLKEGNEKTVVGEDEVLMTDLKRKKACETESALPEEVYIEPVNEQHPVITDELYKFAIRSFDSTLKKLDEPSLECIHKNDSKQVEIYRTIVISEIRNWNYAVVFRLSKKKNDGQLTIKTIKKVADGAGALEKELLEIPLSLANLEEFDGIISESDFWESPRREDVIRRNPRPHCFFEAIRGEEYKWSSRIGIGKENRLRMIVKYFLNKIDWENEKNDVLSHLNSEI